MTDAQVSGVRELTKGQDRSDHHPSRPRPPAARRAGAELAQPHRARTDRPTNRRARGLEKARRAGTAPSVGAARSRRRHGFDQGSAGNAPDSGSGVARKRAGSASVPGSTDTARSAGSRAGKSARSLIVLSRRSTGAAKASQRFRGRAR